MVLSVTRLDLKYAIIKPEFKPEEAVGMCLAHAERSFEGAVMRRTAIRAASEVVVESDWTSSEEAVLLATLEPETPYVLVGVGSRV